MSKAHADTLQHSGIGESSGSASGGSGRKEEPYEPFAGKLRPPSKAERRSRFVLAATDHLQDKMTKLEGRMHCLEDALSIIYTRYSDKPHPLLAEGHNDLLDDSGPDTKRDGAQSRRSPGPEDPLGTLLVDSQGGSHFFGPSGGSESQETRLPSSSAGSVLAVRELEPSYFPPAVIQCYQAFPFTPPNVPTQSVQSSIETYLPTVERATALRNIFCKKLAWLRRIVPQQQLEDELIPAVYKLSPGDYGPHELSMLFSVFSLASLVDMLLPPCNVEAQHYHYLARASLALQPIIGQQSISTAKALHLMSIYNSMCGKESNLDQSYRLLDLTSQVAVRIGLHVDPSSWGIQGSEAYSRRVYFWHLMSDVLWQSLITGRPPGPLTSSQADCRVPSEEEESIYEQEELPAPHTIWGYQAISECLVPVTEAALAVKPPDYETILKLDKKIRQLPASRSLSGESLLPRPEEGFRIFSRSHYHELMLLFLHRAYFAQAMSEQSADPLNSPYGHSVSTAYTSACIVLQDVREQYSKAPSLWARIWKLWSFTFTAAMIVGTVAIRGTHLQFEPPALQELEATCEMFESAAESNIRAALAAPLLRSMLQKAHIASKAYRRGELLPPSEFEEELSVLSGHPSPAQSVSSRATSPRSVQHTDRTPRQGETGLHYNLPPLAPPAISGAWVSRPQSAPVVASPLPASRGLTAEQSLPGGFRLGGPQLQQTFVNLVGRSSWNDRAAETEVHYGQTEPSYNTPAPTYQPAQFQASPAFAPVNIATSRLGEDRSTLPRSSSNPPYSAGPTGFQPQLVHPQPMQSLPPAYPDRDYEMSSYPPAQAGSSSTMDGLVTEPQWGWQPAYPSPVPRRGPPQP
ncbi:hypothetical protein NMY22_g887 [Coprinellus aureogranulatus]|nr:hypothetical protein NMY22_g887 [Coprinellus aureogranulatus]